jgi:hypothetical protein
MGYLHGQERRRSLQYVVPKPMSAVSVCLRYGVYYRFSMYFLARDFAFTKTLARTTLVAEHSPIFGRSIDSTYPDKYSGVAPKGTCVSKICRLSQYIPHTLHATRLSIDCRVISPRPITVNQWCKVDLPASQPCSTFLQALAALRG